MKHEKEAKNIIEWNKRYTTWEIYDLYEELLFIHALNKKGKEVLKTIRNLEKTNKEKKVVMPVKELRDILKK